MNTKLFEQISEVIGWIGIAISPTLMGGIIGYFVYNSNPTLFRLILAILIALIGLVVGIIWATKVYKSKNGTVWFLSRISATPEFDDLEEKEEKEKN